MFSSKGECIFLGLPPIQVYNSNMQKNLYEADVLLTSPGNSVTLWFCVW